VNARGLLEYFSGGREWEIIHFAMFVDPMTGDLLAPGAAAKGGSRRNDRIPVLGVENWIETSKARLVLIVTCDSLLLGGRIGRITNTIAGYKPIDVRAALDWSDIFYRFLAEGCPLSEAFNRAADFTNPGLVLISRKDFRFSGRQDRARPRPIRASA
jgi:hypothetical protein